MATTEQAARQSRKKRPGPDVAIDELEVIVDPDDGTASVWSARDDHLSDDGEATLAWVSLDSDYLFYLEEWR